MLPIQHFHRVLSDGEVEQLHDQALQLLEDPGIRLENTTLLKSLQTRGAKVDLGSEIVRFPRRLVEETIAVAREEEQRRSEAGNPASETNYPDQLTFSWHTPFHNRVPDLEASFGGGAPMYYDHEAKSNRYANSEDALRLIQLAEGIPQVVTVGNAVHYLKETGGGDVPPKMVAIKGAALVAKHSSKPGCTSIIDRRQLPYLMEMGRIVKGSAKAYFRNPILVNIHDTESPLRLTRPEAGIIEDMARQRLPIFILPMVLIGISSPVYPIAAAVISAAEILAVWTAVKALRQDCPVQARAVSGVLNPATGAASFAAPEAVLVDLAVAQLFRERYGIPCGTGVGLIDAPVPGTLSIFERTFKAFCSCLAGEPSFPVGIIGGAVVFSPEQVFIDLDVASTQIRYMRGIGGEHFAESLKLIRERGIRGLFVDTENTARNFRECLMIPEVLSRLKSTDVANALAHDPVEAAHRRFKEILMRTPLHHIGEEQARAIDRVVKKAEDALASISGAAE